MPIDDIEIDSLRFWIDGKEIGEIETFTIPLKFSNNIDFFETTSDPKKILDQGIEVPFWYLIWWYHTYGCNNWRKRHGLPMQRKRKGRRKKTMIKISEQLPSAAEQNRKAQHEAQNSKTSL